MNQLQKDTLEFAAETASETANEAKMLREEWFRLNTELEHTKADLSEWRGKAVRKEAEAIEARKELERVRNQLADFLAMMGDDAVPPELSRAALARFAEKQRT